MMKLAVLSGLVLSASCMVLHQPQIPLTYGVQSHNTPNYNFAYEVNDAHTGDIKSQHESRRGESVLGQYTLLQPDGVRRTVDYRADEHAGFRATVNNEGRQAQSQYQVSQPQYQVSQPQYQVSQRQYQVSQPEYQVSQPQYQVSQPQYQVSQPQYQVSQPQYQAQHPSQAQVQANEAQRSNAVSDNLSAYAWPAPTPSQTPAPAVAISRSSIVQTFSHGNHNPWA